MKCTILAISAFLLTSSHGYSFAQQPASIQEYSYNLGVQVTTQVRQQLTQSGIKLDETAFLRGVQDVLADEQPKASMDGKQSLFKGQKNEK